MINFSVISGSSLLQPDGTMVYIRHDVYLSNKVISTVTLPFMGSETCNVPQPATARCFKAWIPTRYFLYVCSCQQSEPYLKQHGMSPWSRGGGWPSGPVLLRLIKATWSKLIAFKSALHPLSPSASSPFLEGGPVPPRWGLAWQRSSHLHFTWSVPG